MEQKNKFHFLPYIPPDPWRIVTDQNVKKILDFFSEANENPFYSFQMSFNKEIFSFMPKVALYRFKFQEFCQQITINTNKMMLDVKESKELVTKTDIVKVEELKMLFGVLSLMQDFHFADYRDHFKITEVCLFPSPIANLMSLTRFQQLLKYLSLEKNESCFEKEFEFYNDLFGLMSNSEYVPNECLVLHIKKVPSVILQTFRLLLLYDKKGFLLNGLIFRYLEFDEENVLIYQDKILLILEKFIGKNYTLILPQVLLPLSFIEQLQKNYKFKCLGFILDNFTIPYSLQNEEFVKNTIYCFNDSNKLITIKKLSSYQDNVYYYVFGTHIFYNQYSDSETIDQALKFVDEIKKKISNIWKIKVWKEFDLFEGKRTFPLILFLFKTFLHNCYLLYGSQFMEFKEFKEEVIKELISYKKIAFLISKKSSYQIANNCNEDRHYPGKLSFCKFCKVCYKIGQKKKKSIYKCMSCSLKFKKDIPLCVTCFEKYHEDPLKYNSRKKVTKKKI